MIPSSRKRSSKIILSIYSAGLKPQSSQGFPKIFSEDLPKNKIFWRSLHFKKSSLDLILRKISKKIWVLGLNFYSIKFSSYRSSGVRVIIDESNVFDFIFSKLKAKQKFDSNIGKFDYILVKISKIKLKFDSNKKMFD